MTDQPISIIRDDGDDTTVDIDNPGDEIDDEGDYDNDYDSEVDEDDDGDDVEKLSKQQQQSQPSVGRRWIDNSENFLNIGCHHPRCLSLLLFSYLLTSL